MRSARWLPFLALANFGACYRYVPADPAELRSGIEIRTHLSQAGVERFRQPFGPGPDRIDGRLIRWDRDSLAVEISARTWTAGFPATTLVQTLELSREQVAAVERRELDRLRTAGLVTAIVTGAVAAVLATGIYGSEQGDPEAPTEEPRVGIWVRFPLVP